LIYNLKSGTNELHGEAFHFFRNNKLNARPFFDRTGETNVVRYNQWGYSLGGPVYVPGVVDGRNRLFWTQSYEGWKQRGASATRIALVPTSAMIAQVTDPASRALLDQFQIPVSDSGQIEQAAGETLDEYKVNVKIDWIASSRDTIAGRYARSRQTAGAAGRTCIHTNLNAVGTSATADPQQASLA
ncbi:MAG: hypothetical protein GY953_40545, partial [bacterium]|nr:hypothetical protein [bacterium]